MSNGRQGGGEGTDPLSSAEAFDSADEPYRQALVRHRLFGDAAPTIGRFVIEDRIGAGTMGVVYRARDKRLDRPVALKLLRGGLSDVAAQRLMREARALASVHHPNVVTIYEVGDVDGHPFIAMEFVEGQTLAAWQQGRSVADCLRAYTEAAAGLTALHLAGLVHRDFKPANTLVGADGRVRVADLGLVRGVGDAPSTSARGVGAGAPVALTVTGGLLGTPAYMAPEQYAGQPATPQSDQYALCVALVEALTGERPPAEAPGALPRHPNLTPRLRAALRRGLEVAPADRWLDVATLVSAWSARPASRAWRLGVLMVAGAAALTALPVARISERPAPGRPLGRPAAAGTPEALSRVERLFGRDPTLATALLAALEPTQPGWAPLARRALTTPTAWATTRLDADAYRLQLVPGRGLVAYFDDGGVGLIGADGSREPVGRVEDGGLADPRRSRGGPALPAPAKGRPQWIIDADTVAYEGGDGAVELMTLSSGRTRPLMGHARSVLHAVGDSTRVATLTQARVVRIWARAAFEGTPRGRHEGKIWSAARDPSGRWLATAAHDGTVGLLDLRGDGALRRLRGHEAPAIFGVAFSPDGEKLASTGGDRTARVWSMGDLDRPPRRLDGHEGWAYALAWSPDGRWIATGDREGGVRVWPADRPEAGRLLGRHAGEASMRRVHTLVFTGASDAVISGAKNGTLMRWPLDGGAPRALPRTGNGADVRRLAKDRILAMSYGGGSRLLSDAGEVVATFGGEVAAMGWAVSESGDRFAIAHADGSIRVWDVAQPAAPRWTLPPVGAPAEALAFDPSAARLAVGDTRGGVAVYAIGEPRPRWRLPAHDAAVRALVFEGDALLSASFDGTIRRWAVPADAEGLRRHLQRRVTDCLLPSQRTAWLGEPEPIAEEGHAACVAASRAARAAAFGPGQR